MSEELVCDGCGEKDEGVLPSGPFWVAGGRNCFDFQWFRDDQPRHLCEACDLNWVICDCCGAWIERYYYGMNYLPEDYEQGDICPGCWREKHERDDARGNDYRTSDRATEAGPD